MSAPPNPKLAAAIRAIWEKAFKVVHHEISDLDRMIAQLQRGELDAPARGAAENTAHKLAGSLGTFGFPEASRIARELETRLRAPSPADAPVLADLVLALRMQLLAHTPADPDRPEAGTDPPES